MLEFDRYFGQSEEDLTRDGNIEGGIRTLIDDLHTSLEGRFQDMTEGVLEAMRITSFHFWPEENDNGNSFVYHE